MKIICIGRNYVEHAHELKNDVPSQPVFFLKHDTSLLPPRSPFYLPDFSKEIQYEVELVYKICKKGKNILEEFAHRYYDEISVGLDFTARDIQQYQKERGLPWEPAKAFDHSSPVGSFIPLSSVPDSKKIRFRLDKNGTTVQQADNSYCIFSIDKIIAYVSTFITLRKGDLIYTGTPSGVGPLSTGDRLECYLEDELRLKVNVK